MLCASFLYGRYGHPNMKRLRDKRRLNLIIQSSSIGMESAGIYTSVSMEAFSLHASAGKITNFQDALLAKKPDNSDSNDTDKKADNESDENTGVSNSLMDSYNALSGKFGNIRSAGISSTNQMQETLNRLRVQCIQFLIRLLFGSKYTGEDEIIDYGDNSETPANTGMQNLIQISTTYSHMTAEYEETSFSVEGSVVTADGTTHEFNLNCVMSRAFLDYYEESVSIPSFCDPLVINLDSNMATVCDQTIMFDLDCDGQLDEISQLNSSSGFIALDLNEDGIINDGSELFGTQSGDGFLDLSRYDSDNNGWIDEADDVWDKLKICVMNSDGTQSLYKLSEKDVGAICLKNADTNFHLKDLATNRTNAAIRRTGIFLYENGNVGTIQHLDLAKYSKEA